MGYLGRWELDDLLTFTANTHTPSTGAGTDADSVPAWRLYEDETGTAILNGTMAKLDDANTVGFYSEQITLSAASGFEAGKSYTIYIAAVVGGVTGTMSHSFQVEAAPATAAALVIAQADLDALQIAVAALSTTVFPSGSVTFTYTVTNSVSGLPLPGVDIWITTDLAGVNVVWRGTSDSFGVARDINDNLPSLDPGTFYFFRNLAGYIFSPEPDVETVS